MVRGVLEAKGLSASTITRLKQTYGNGYDAFCKVPVEENLLVHIRIESIHSSLHSDDNKLCALIVIGINGVGKRQNLAIQNGTRESTFAKIQHRIKRSKRCLSSDTILHIPIQLVLCTEKRRRGLRGFDYLPKGHHRAKINRRG